MLKPQINQQILDWLHEQLLPKGQPEAQTQTPAATK